MVDSQEKAYWKTHRPPVSLAQLLIRRLFSPFSDFSHVSAGLDFCQTALAEQKNDNIKFCGNAGSTNVIVKLII